MGCGESQQCPMGRASSALALPMGILRALGGREAIDREEVFIISEKIPSSAHKSARERSPCFALSPGCLPWVLKGMPMMCTVDVLNIVDSKVSTGPETSPLVPRADPLNTSVITPARIRLLERYLVYTSATAAFTRLFHPPALVGRWPPRWPRNRPQVDLSGDK